MEILEIKKENAVLAYESATQKTKLVLENLFGTRVFKKDAISRIKTYADACEDLEIDQLELSDFTLLPERDQVHAFASHKLTTIIRALNEGWEPDWTNSNEAKYYGWFKSVGSPAGFSFHGYHYGHSDSDVGSRLCFKSRELAEYAGTQFLSIYREFMVIEK